MRASFSSGLRAVVSISLFFSAPVASAAFRASVAPVAAGEARLTFPAAPLATASSAELAPPVAGLETADAPVVAADAWREPEAPPSAAASEPAPVSAEGEASPEARQILARARAKGVTDETIGGLIQSSRNLDEAAARLHAAGVLKAGQASLAEGRQRRAFNVLLHELWYDAATAAPRQFRFDLNAAVPATIVEHRGIEFHIHGFVHGFIGAPWGAEDVRRMANDIAALPRAVGLYSEQNLPSAYGYFRGLEFLDHRVMEGGKIALRTPDMGAAPSARTDVELMLAVIKVNAVKLGLQAEYASMPPAEARLSKAYMDMVLQGAFHLEFVRRLILPYPLAESFTPEERLSLLDPGPPNTSYYQRSAAMAAAAVEDALERGLKEAHILCGYVHAWDIAWLLSQPSSPVLNAARADYRAAR